MYSKFGKRLFDIVFSFLGIAILAPLFILTAAAIKIESSGPVFFRQPRLGKCCKHFNIWKFRSMVSSDAVGLSITTRNDPRITRVGKFIRRSKIDELPQLFDVFVGNMSIVGPRPEVPKYLDHYSLGDQKIIFSVRPGITDYYSLAARDESLLIDGSNKPETFYVSKILPSKVASQRDYVKSYNLKMDFCIIIKTIRTLFL